MDTKEKSPPPRATSETISKWKEMLACGLLKRIVDNIVAVVYGHLFASEMLNSGFVIIALKLNYENASGRAA